MEHHGLSDEERELARLVREFAEDVVAPQSYEADRTRTLSMDVVAQMGELGLLGLPFPEDVGGQGGDLVALCLAVEALARVDPCTASARRSSDRSCCPTSSRGEPWPGSA